ncbi:MAG: lysophospholipid acyltransferase family protein [Candidatus Omnitrophota bacterium]|nr:lysophospholipid acyltransferase family protein [Candidatus Omnitrophota bacterium]
MDYKKIAKIIRYFFARTGMGTCSLIIKFMPAPCIYGFAEKLGLLGYLVARRQRDIALETLSTAFGEHKSRRQLKEIAKSCFIFVAKSGVELLFLMDRPKLLKERVRIEGRQNLDNALSRGKGVILVSAHFGNFPLMLAYLSLCGYKTAGIMRPMRDAKVEKVFMDKRTRLGIKTIYSQPRSTCVNNTIQALRNNELVVIPIDQNFGSGGVFVNFFGRKAATATGPLVLAQRTEAAVLPCFIIRQKDDSHKIIFEPALEIKAGRDAEETVLINIQRLTEIIESYIRKYPAEWGWFHRRWKSKPN